MKYIEIGTSGVKSSNLIMGCMRLKEKTVKETEMLIRTVMDEGINFFDHADIYGRDGHRGECEEIFGEAAMMVSGSWSIQNFLDIDESFDFGIFPFPNQTGDSKLIFEPNITVMASANSEHQDAINCVLDVLTGNKDLAVEIYDDTKTASMLKPASRAARFSGGGD